MQIYHISDTHGFHKELIDIPECDVIIHSGDFSHQRHVKSNYNETIDFITWYGNLKTSATKILVAGNHDSYAFHHHNEFKSICDSLKIHYLMNESITIDDTKFYGTPYQPSFGNWFFQKPRHSINRIWNDIPEDVNVLIVHGPPKGILDLSYSIDRKLEFCGCKSLKNTIKYRLKDLRACLFGHIHDNEDIDNYGLLERNGILYSNGALVKDGKMDGLIHQGRIITI